MVTKFTVIRHEEERLREEKKKRKDKYVSVKEEQNWDTMPLFICKFNALEKKLCNMTIALLYTSTQTRYKTQCLF